LAEERVQTIVRRAGVGKEISVQFMAIEAIVMIMNPPACTAFRSVSRYTACVQNANPAGLEIVQLANPNVLPRWPSATPKAFNQAEIYAEGVKSNSPGSRAHPGYRVGTTALTLKGFHRATFVCD
jgi:hypothetical protein